MKVISLGERRRKNPILQALLVTLLWSISWVLIKLGMQPGQSSGAGMPALTFAGYRYCLAFVCLTFPLLRQYRYSASGFKAALKGLPKPTWQHLILLGIVYYTLVQGAQYVSLAYLPAAAVSLLLNFTPLLVAVWSSLRRIEAPVLFQWGGIGLAVSGAAIYLLPLNAGWNTAGMLAAITCLVANAAASVLGRRINQPRYGKAGDESLSPLLVTWVSMGIGGAILLLCGGLLQGWGQVGWREVLIIAWLAVVSTALAFTWWNESLQSLSAVQSSVINGAMMPQIALLAWLFLGEPLTYRQIGGLILAGAGMLVVNLRGRRRADI